MVLRQRRYGPSKYGAIEIGGRIPHAGRTQVTTDKASPTSRICLWFWPDRSART